MRAQWLQWPFTGVVLRLVKVSIVLIVEFRKLFILKVARSFRPDFVLIRQAPRDGSRDFRSTLLGLKYGGVPCINSLNSIYQFQVRHLVLFLKTNFFVLIQEMSTKATEQLSKRALMFGFCLVAYVLVAAPII